MKVGILLKSQIEPLLYEEYKKFAEILQNLINIRISSNKEAQVIDINKQSIQEVAKVDIIIFSGGEDIHPEYYNSKIKYSDNLYTFNKQRDEIELEILEKYHKTKVIFGICRGIQLINVFLKGTLFQHLPYDLRGIVIENAHKIYPEIQENENKRKLRHIIKGKILNLITGNIEKFKMVNSRHHQGIAKLGKDLEILGISRDGIVEIIKHQNLPILAVQYHPEQSDIIENQLPLLDYFINTFISTNTY